MRILGILPRTFSRLLYNLRVVDWKKLSDNGDYLEIISRKSEAVTAPEVFFVISAFLSLNQGQKAMQLLLEKRQLLWDSSPSLLLKANFETRFALRQFDEAYADLSYFQNLPYVSQKIEEQLRDLPHRIRVEEIASGGPKPIDEEEMHALLRDERDPAALLAYLNSLKKLDLEPFFGDLHSLLEAEDVHDDVKSYALMLLSAHHDDTTVSFEKGGKRFTLIPQEVRMPYGSPEYLRVRSLVQQGNEPSVSEVAGELLDQYVLTRYPDSYDCPAEPDLDNQAFRYLAKRYLSVKPNSAPMPVIERAEKIDGTLRSASALAA